MTSLKINSMLIFMMFMLQSCLIGSIETQDSLGFPDKITIPKEGGNVHLVGTGQVGEIRIEYDNGKYVNLAPEVISTIPTNTPIDAPDSMRIQNDWLQLEWQLAHDYINITAKPNISNDKRKVRIRWDSGYSYTEIDIIQNGK